MENQYGQELITVMIVGTTVILMMCFAVVMFFKIYQKRILEAELEKAQIYQQHSKDLARKYIDGEERERGRVARELHDGLGSSLWAVKLNLGMVSKSDSFTPMEAQAINDANKLLEDSINSIREIAWNLAPPGLAHHGLSRTIREFCGKIRGKTMVEFVERQEYRRLTDNQSLFAFRVIQELVKNALAHAQAERILVDCLWDSNAVVFVVSDDGVGFDPSADRGGMGLFNIKHRAEAIGADFFFASKVGEGSRFTLVIKYTHDNREQ